MHETLIRFPHSVGAWPLFGWGWCLGLLGLGLAIRVAWLASAGARMRHSKAAKGEPKTDAGWVSMFLFSESYLWVIAGFVLVKVIPAIELKNLNGDPVGLAIRGYGMFLLIAVVSAIGLAMHRAKRFGLDPDWVLRIAPMTFFGGIIGARLFYVIQYRDQFIDDSLVATLQNLVKFTEGGLVVYGSFIGGGLAALYFVLRYRLPVRRMGDIIVPCLFIGVFFGRMGCLMHGCCWGGACGDTWYGLQFPTTSPVYRDQVDDGSLLGFKIDPETSRVTEVLPDSLAAREGLQTGDTVDYLVVEPDLENAFDATLPAEEAPLAIRGRVGGKPVYWSSKELPRHANPVFPAQLVSSLGGLLLCGFLSLIQPNWLREGGIMWLGFVGYAVLRFGLEIIRVDEAGQFGTSISISQWVSMLVVVLSILGWLWTRKMPPAGPPRPIEPERSPNAGAAASAS